MADIRVLRAAAGAPNGLRRVDIRFNSQLRAVLVERDGKSFYQVTGYATVFNRPYKMYDAFGEYTETVAGTALDDSLAKSPDVVFLTNHRGLAMARTTNDTLKLEKDTNGLGIEALLNAQRTDVSDLASAIHDKIVTEMSFAFMLGEDGYQWNDDYTALTLTKIDIDRGDVSAVNYGANPYTSIGMRSAEAIISDLRNMPAGALPDVMEEMTNVFGIAGSKLAREAVIRFQTATRSVVSAQMKRAQNEGMTPAEIRETFGGEIDFSDWEIVDETGEPDEAEPEVTTDSRSSEVSLLNRRVRDIHITGDSDQ